MQRLKFLISFFFGLSRLRNGKVKFLHNILKVLCHKTSGTLKQYKIYLGEKPLFSFMIYCCRTLTLQA